MVNYIDEGTFYLRVDLCETKKIRIPDLLLQSYHRVREFLENERVFF